MELGHSSYQQQSQTRFWPLTLPQAVLARITLLNLLLNSHPFPDPPKETLGSAHVNHGSAVTKQRSDDLRELWLFGTGTRRRWTRWLWDLWESRRETQWSPTLRYDCAHGHTHNTSCTNTTTDKHYADVMEWRSSNKTSYETHTQTIISTLTLHLCN